MILAHVSKMLQKDISFSLKVQMVQAKMNLYLNLPVIASFVCKNTHSMYSHKHSAMTMNNILTSGGFNTMSFSTICVFRKYIT